ncbi:hypothetical protein QL285_026388 [Trifolium repens]|nr:hypothetical protein QL285_045181 [Trifolium repens]KAK2427832.1 hypothetical protein QL285_026388 [Trifolium repens]
MTNPSIAFQLHIADSSSSLNSSFLCFLLIMNICHHYYRMSLIHQPGCYQCFYYLQAIADCSAMAELMWCGVLFSSDLLW